MSVGTLPASRWSRPPDNVVAPVADHEHDGADFALDVLKPDLAVEVPDDEHGGADLGTTAETIANALRARVNPPVPPGPAP